MKRPLVITFSGRFGAGKTTLSRVFASAQSALCVSFGDFVRSQARARHLNEQSGRVLQDVGQELIATQGIEWLVLQVIDPWLAGPRNESLAIDGVRHLAALAEIRRHVQPVPTKLVFIDGTQALSPADDRTADHPTEKDVVSGLRDAADLIIPSIMNMDDALALLNDAYNDWQRDGA